jgi:adenylate kinase
MGQRARLLVLGRQGSGKGTQCARLADALGIPHISSGDLLRAEVAAGSPLGRRVAEHLETGELVPDDLVVELVASHLGGSEGQAAGYVLDGFPRTLAQGQALFEVLGPAAVDRAVALDVPSKVVIPRLAARRTCEGCGQPTVAEPGQAEARCEACGGRLVQRADDTEEAIAVRLRTYDEETVPLLAWLDGLGLLTTVDGVGNPDEVAARVLAAVTPHVPAAGSGSGSRPAS